VDDAVLAAILTVLAVILGAALLAVFLLYKGWRKNQAQITRLHAEVTAAKIAALSMPAQSVADRAATAPPLAAVPDLDDNEDEGEDEPDGQPTRRRRHLSLYLGGGGIAAFLFPLVESARPRKAAAFAATAVSVATLSGGAVYLTPYEVDPGTGVQNPSATATDRDDLNSQRTAQDVSTGSDSTIANRRPLPTDEPTPTSAASTDGGTTDQPAEQPTASSAEQPPTAEQTTPAPPPGQEAQPGRTPPGQIDNPGQGRGRGNGNGKSDECDGDECP
jgi:hypothetical protein